MKGKVKNDGLHVGCSGFRYHKWCGSFYTKGATLAEMLAHYGSNFSSVEIRDTYHGFIRPETYTQWLQAVPEGFTFSIKAPRYFLMERAGKEREEEWTAFVKSLEPLRERKALGAILLQTPATLQRNEELLQSWLEAYIRPDLDMAFEFRHASWATPETGLLLDRFSADRVCAYRPYQEDEPDVKPRCSLKYIRLLVPKRALNYDYAYNTLVPWGERLLELKEKADRIYFYFNNPGKGQAPLNARNLVKRILNAPPES